MVDYEFEERGRDVKLSERSYVELSGSLNAEFFRMFINFSVIRKVFEDLCLRSHRLELNRKGKKDEVEDLRKQIFIKIVELERRVALGLEERCKTLLESNVNEKDYLELFKSSISESLDLLTCSIPKAGPSFFQRTMNTGGEKDA